MPGFTNFLQKEITSEQIDPKEARRLGHFVEVSSLNVKKFRSGRVIEIVQTPKTKAKGKAKVLIPKRKNVSKQNITLKGKSLSFESLFIEPEFVNEFDKSALVINTVKMSDFSTADFNRMIPE